MAKHLPASWVFKCCVSYHTKDRHIGQLARDASSMSEPPAKRNPLHASNARRVIIQHASAHFSAPTSRRRLPCVRSSRSCPSAASCASSSCPPSWLAPGLVCSFSPSGASSSNPASSSLRWSVNVPRNWCALVKTGITA